MRSQVEVPGRKSICLDHPSQNMAMFSLLQTERTYVQTFVRSKVFVRSSFDQKSLYPDFHAFKITYDQTFVRSKVRMSRPLCLYVQTYCQFHSYKFYTSFFNVFFSSICILGVMVLTKCPAVATFNKKYSMKALAEGGANHPVIAA